MIDRAELVRLVGNRRTPASSVTPPTLWPTTDPREGRADPYQQVLAGDPYGRTTSRATAAADRLAAAGISATSPVSHTLTVYDSKPLQLLAEHLADRLEPLGVELSIEEVSTFSLFERGETGRLELWLAGLRWPPAIGAELRRVVPTHTNTDRMPETLDGLYLNWQTTLKEQS
ncbi:MAG: bacterial extracellular solute-binding protein [halophilic archaeon J07HX5]|nr:MAG: bacterial extracellular solute-binding protein [halophilic archaeon J07HX5]